jgi:peptide/nickel transport system substrate-binding protein
VRFNPFFSRAFFVIALVCLLVVPTLAQEDPAPLGPGEGLPVVEGNFGGDIATTNPLLVNDGSSQDVVNRLFPTFIGADPETGLPTPDAPRSIAKSWTFNEDRTVMTVTLDEGWTWSDGTPVTSADVKYAYDAIASGEVDTPLGSYISSIESLEAPDPQTVVITFAEANCNAEIDASNIPVVPAHKYQEVYPTFADMTAESEYNLNPEVTAGPFKFENFRAGEQVTTLADQNYPDSPAGHVVPEGWVYKNFQDQLVIVEQFLAGDVTFTTIPEDREAEMRERAAAGEFTLYETPSTGWQVLLFNQANPDNPQPGLDEEGNRIEQEPHPIFGDVRVREAVAHAINHEDLNAGAFSGTGMPVGGPMLPQSWAYNENIQPYEYNPELSMQLLDEAGFVDDDNDPATPRVATEDALYAEPGTVLEFDLTTFIGNPSIDASSILIQDQLKQVGFQVNLDIIEFTPMLDKLVGQTYDALMVFWGVTNVNPNEMYDQLGLESDVPGSGFNTGSFYNEEFEELMKSARNLPGCDPAERKALYDRAQEIIHDQVPYYLVNTSIVPVAISPKLENFDPKRNSMTWNLPAWQLRP